MNDVSARVRGLQVAQSASIRIVGRTLEILRDLVQTRTGMLYDDTRLHFLRDRIVPLALERGFDSLLDYYYLLKYDQDADGEWLRVIDALAVQETYFWREYEQVSALVDTVIPSLMAAGRTHIRIWSMPCATGEEPLSIAMALEEACLFSKVDLEVHASDASEAALQRARAGTFGARAFRQLPPALRDQYFTQTAANEWTVHRQLHQRVRSWRRLNAVQPDEWGSEADADVIFCRNLFIYFNSATVERVVAAFADRMRTPGYLCIAAAESLLRLDTPFALEDVGGALVYVRR